MGITQPVQVYLLRKWRPGDENIEVSDKSETSGNSYSVIFTKLSFYKESEMLHLKCCEKN